MLFVYWSRPGLIVAKFATSVANNEFLTKNESQIAKTGRESEMIDIKKAIGFASGFEETSEEPHFEKLSFRVRKKIFATLDEANRTVVVKLTEVEQSVFCSFEGNSVRPESRHPGQHTRGLWTRGAP